MNSFQLGTNILSKENKTLILLDSAKIRKKIHVARSQKRTYQELEDFKSTSIDQLPAFHFYKNFQSKVRDYRLLFASFSLLFFVLSYFSFTLSLSWPILFLFESSIKIKWVITLFSLLLATSAIGIGYSLSAAKEATQEILKKAKRTLEHSYNRQKMTLDHWHYFTFNKDYQKARALRQRYREIHDILEEKREEALSLLDKINAAPMKKENEREKLRNQALSELYEAANEAILSLSRLDKVTPISVMM